MDHHPKESYTWTIRDKKTVKRLNKARECDSIDSIIFTMFGCKWFIKFRPNGLSKGRYLGHAFLILYLTGLPPNRSTFNFRYKLSLLESKTVCRKATTFKKGYMNISWDKGILLTQKIKKLKQFTLSVTIELLAVYDNKGNEVTHQYKINDEYDEINLENILLKKQKNKVMRRISMPKILRSRRCSSVAQLNNTGTYDMVTCLNRIQKLEVLMQNTSDIVGVLSDKAKVKTDLEKEGKQYGIDIMKSNDQFAVIMTEINQMKRSINECQQQIQSLQQTTHLTTMSEKLQVSTQICPFKIQKLKQWFALQVKLPQYFDVFVQHDIIEMDILYKIKKDELKEMGIYKIGHQLKILQQIENLMTNDASDDELQLDEHTIITSDATPDVLLEDENLASDSDELYTIKLNQCEGNNTKQ